MSSGLLARHWRTGLGAVAGATGGGLYAHLAKLQFGEEAA